MIDKDRIRQKEKNLLETLHEQFVARVNTIDSVAHKEYTRQTIQCYSDLKTIADIDECVQSKLAVYQKVRTKNLKFLTFVEVVL